MHAARMLTTTLMIRIALRFPTHQEPVVAMGVVMVKEGSAAAWEDMVTENKNDNACSTHSGGTAEVALTKCQTAFWVSLLQPSAALPWEPPLMLLLHLQLLC